MCPPDPFVNFCSVYTHPCGASAQSVYIFPHVYVGVNGCPCLLVKHVHNSMTTYVEQGGPFKGSSHEWLAMHSVGGADLFKDNDMWGRFHVGSCGKHQYVASTACRSTERGGPAVAWAPLWPALLFAIQGN